MASDPPFILAIDQGTTSTRAILFDSTGASVASHAIELRQIYPDNGWVEHDAEEIWQAALNCCRVAVKGVAPTDIAAIGITNQRETTVLWDRRTGQPLYNAIVWQDRRTAERCRALKAEGHEPDVTKRTGLLLDPYFSATKAQWLLDHVPGARTRAENGELAFGTIDSWLIYKLTGGRVHATDVTNASRTMLLNLRDLAWDDDAAQAVRDPARRVARGARQRRRFRRDGQRNCSARPSRSWASRAISRRRRSDRHVLRRAMSKSTYGTGCFALVNTGAGVPVSNNRLLEHGGLSRGRQDGLRDRGQHLRRRRRRAMAARRGGPHPRVARDRGAGAHSRNRRKDFTSYPPSRDWARRTGIPMRAARSWDSPATWAWRKSRAPRSTPSVSRRAIFSKRWRPTCARPVWGSPRRSKSTAAWSGTTGSASGSPI